MITHAGSANRPVFFFGGIGEIWINRNCAWNKSHPYSVLLLDPCPAYCYHSIDWMCLLQSVGAAAVTNLGWNLNMYEKKVENLSPSKVHLCSTPWTYFFVTTSAKKCDVADFTICSCAAGMFCSCVYMCVFYVDHHHAQQLTIINICTSPPVPSLLSVVLPAVVPSSAQKGAARATPMKKRHLSPHSTILILLALSNR